MRLDGRISRATLEQSLEALLVRVRWYEVRGHCVPEEIGLAFNQLCCVLEKPEAPPWIRWKP